MEGGRRVPGRGPALELKLCEAAQPVRAQTPVGEKSGRGQKGQRPGNNGWRKGLDRHTGRTWEPVVAHAYGEPWEEWERAWKTGSVHRARAGRVTGAGARQRDAREKVRAAGPRLPACGAGRPPDRSVCVENRGGRAAGPLGFARPGYGSATSARRSPDRRCSQAVERKAAESASGAANEHRRGGRRRVGANRAWPRAAEKDELGSEGEWLPTQMPPE